MENNIYKYIEEFDLNRENFLEFVTNLCDYFSEKFGVRKCPVKILEIKETYYDDNYIPPAIFKELIIKYKNRDTGEVWSEMEGSIEFSTQLLNNINKARIVKLAAHEWTHFYDFLFKYGELDINQANEDYRDLILKSQQYVKYEKDIKEKYGKAFIYIDKLCAKETVADKHAQTFLKELYKNITNKTMKKQIQEQIQNHEKQVEGYRNYLEKNKIEEDYIIEQ